MRISKYSVANEEDVINAIRKEPDWKMFTSHNALDNYKRALRENVTFVAYENVDFCGYIRAILDEGIAIYVSELFVVKEHRNKKIGQYLLETIRKEFESITTYILSDEDLYYEKKGYLKIGSIFTPK